MDRFHTLPTGVDLLAEKAAYTCHGTCSPAVAARAELDVLDS
ncbi:hypothetical protein ABN034_33625 [Actinopolymorpha sp. B11F2]